MATEVETAKLIRFALGELSGENGHYAFEHLCRQVARRRIVSNVLPATGPVADGGDQGRDFETFHTYLGDEPPHASRFTAVASDDVIVFACTIRRTGLRAKFKADITAICTQGTSVDRIYIFAAEQVPTRLRHDTQAWARDRHGVALEIVDGVGLAEWLAEPDLFWIARQYLHLPGEVGPENGTGPRSSAGGASRARALFASRTPRRRRWMIVAAAMAIVTVLPAAGYGWWGWGGDTIRPTSPWLCALVNVAKADVFRQPGDTEPLAIKLRDEPITMAREVTVGPDGIRYRMVRAPKRTPTNVAYMADHTLRPVPC